jgi:hypothetical protein
MRPRDRFCCNASDEGVGMCEQLVRAANPILPLTSPLRDDTVQGFAEDLEVR